MGCVEHTEEAGWECERCGPLCRRCAGYREAGQGRIFVCLGCGGVARPILVRRAQREPFGMGSLREAVRWALEKRHLATLAACAITLRVFTFLGALGTFAAEGIVLAVLFHITITAARGTSDFDVPGDFRGFFEDVLGPLLRAAVASLWAWGPVVAFVLWRGGGLFTGGDLARPTGLSALVALLLLLCGTLLFPMALLAGALGTPMVHLLNPLVVVGYALRLGRDYLLVSLFCLAVSVADSVALALLAALDVHVTAIPAALEYFVLLIPAAMMFRALGLLVHARGDELGYGGASAYLVPVLGDARPATDLTPREPEPALESAREPAPAPTPVALDLPHNAAAPSLELARRWSGGDVDGAVELLLRAGRDCAPTALSQGTWIELAKACAARSQARAALLALRRAVEVAPDAANAPQAWLLAARISDESLADRPLSNRFLAELVRRHPSSAEAAFARRRLASRPPG